MVNDVKSGKINDPWRIIAITSGASILNNDEPFDSDDDNNYGDALDYDETLIWNVL